MACNFINVGGSSKNCKENYSGVGSTIYVFTKDDLDAKGLKPKYSDNAAVFEADSFEGLTVHKIGVKAKTGKVTATSNPNAGGFSNVYTGVVANDMDNMAAVARIMNNRTDWGVMVPVGGGKYIVLYDPDFDIEFSMESDTGDTPDSDHGHTVTITQSPMQYALPKWSGNLDVAADGGQISTDAESEEVVAPKIQITVGGTASNITKVEVFAPTVGGLSLSKDGNVYTCDATVGVEYTVVVTTKSAGMNVSFGSEKITVDGENRAEKRYVMTSSGINVNVSAANA